MKINLPHNDPLVMAKAILQFPNIFLVGSAQKLIMRVSAEYRLLNLENADADTDTLGRKMPIISACRYRYRYIGRTLVLTLCFLDESVGVPCTASLPPLPAQTQQTSGLGLWGRRN